MTRIYTSGHGSYLSSGIVTKADISKAKEEFEAIRDSVSGDVKVEYELEPVMESHSTLKLVVDKNGVSIGRHTHDGWDAVLPGYETEVEEIFKQDVFIDENLGFLDFTTREYDTLEEFTEKQVAEEDKEDFIEVANSNPFDD